MHGGKRRIGTLELASAGLCRVPTEERVQTGAGLGGQPAPSLGLGAEPASRGREGGQEREARGVETLKESGPGGRSPPGGSGRREPGGGARGPGGAGRRQGLRWCGESRGGRRHRRRRGRSRARSCHPAAGPRQTPPASGRARTARRPSANNAPAGRRAAWRPTEGQRKRSPEVSPRRALQIRPLFVWRAWSQRGALEGRCDRRAGDPWGDRRPLGEWVAPGLREPGVVPEVQGGARPGGPRSWKVFSIHSRIALFKTGKLSYEFQEGGPTVRMVSLVSLLCVRRETEAL